MVSTALLAGNGHLGSIQGRLSLTPRVCIPYFHPNPKAVMSLLQGHAFNPHSATTDGLSHMEYLGVNKEMLRAPPISYVNYTNISICLSCEN